MVAVKMEYDANTDSEGGGWENSQALDGETNMASERDDTAGDHPSRRATVQIKEEGVCDDGTGLSSSGRNACQGLQREFGNGRKRIKTEEGSGDSFSGGGIERSDRKRIKTEGGSDDDAAIALHAPSTDGADGNTSPKTSQSPKKETTQVKEEDAFDYDTDYDPVEAEDSSGLEGKLEDGDKKTAKKRASECVDNRTGLSVPPAASSKDVSDGSTRACTDKENIDDDMINKLTSGSKEILVNSIICHTFQQDKTINEKTARIRATVTVKKICTLKHNLSTLHSSMKRKDDNYDDAKTLSAISKYLTRLTEIDDGLFTDEILKHTKVGKTVAKLRKILLPYKDRDDTIEQRVYDMADRTVEKWHNRHVFNASREKLESIHDEWGTIASATAAPKSEDRSTQLAKEAKGALEDLGQIEITMKLLRELSDRGQNIIAAVSEFKKRPETKAAAKTLLGKWKSLAEQWDLEAQNCSGRAKERLDVFRQLEAKYKDEGRYKPDMQAFKELRGEYPPPRQHGALPGVPIGLTLGGKGEAAIVGIHCKILAGIDSIKDKACYAICMTGKYDDEDINTNSGNGSSLIVYTGSGGHKRGRQVEDQTENADNQSLIMSYSTEYPIRVLRKLFKSSKNVEYSYDGLYRCIDYTYEPSRDGPKVYRFILEPIEGQSRPPSAFSLMKNQKRGGSTRGRARERLSCKIKKNAGGTNSKTKPA